MTSEYTAMIPDMTTGIRHCGGRTLAELLGPMVHTQSRLTFMIKSGRKVPTPAMPMPDFAVPYAAPMPICRASQPSCSCSLLCRSAPLSFQGTSRRRCTYTQKSWTRQFRPTQRHISNKTPCFVGYGSSPEGTLPCRRRARTSGQTHC